MNGYAATIGMFDGVHLGHQFVLRQLTELARERGLLSLVLTFDRSPRGEAVLTPLAEKVRLIGQAGIDRVEALGFTPQLKAMTARQFMEWMHRELGVATLLTGYDNRFGHNREEGFDDYVRHGHEIGMEVVPGRPLETCAGLRPSSSAVRQCLQAGRVEQARELLGRSYGIDGIVVSGEHIGHRLGFPTANLQPAEAQKVIPAAGVYAVWATIDGGRPRPAMMNIGTRPTFDGHQQTLETHILDFDGDLYGRPLSVSFEGRLRPERRFDGADELQAQLQRDAEQARKLLKQQIQ